MSLCSRRSRLDPLAPLASYEGRSRKKGGLGQGDVATTRGRSERRRRKIRAYLQSRLHDAKGSTAGRGKSTAGVDAGARARVGLAIAACSGLSRARSGPDVQSHCTGNVCKDPSG